ncbi:D-3-phosphoglycerate dehydrogenase [Rhizodiscina lignyota]|uniref:2-oxoglutarate reductase n=1 Tax=Rhizodiscina lignyota TaxID=1504668 RepID=A0A9P4I9K0_9PEZI|nr:D-3-phosphoglycerate dehydrogenase [Rhizodiscina lignyota]
MNGDPTDAQDIIPRVDKLARSVSNSWNSLSTSPSLAFHPPQLRRPSTVTKPLKPFETKNIKVLLLENVNKTGQDLLREQGYIVEALKTSLPEDQLIEKIRDVHVVGIRSKTRLTAKVLREARNLIVIGAFCIGTNQVDLEFAAENGITVFNSPFSNSRSVAELTIAEIIMLSRQAGDRSNELHNGTWNKVSAGCWEVRGKTLGIIGYGHIGSQLSVLAETMGMGVVYYDVLTMMAMGTARQLPSLEKVLAEADFITLHVPELPETKNMIGEKQFSQMKDGSYLINNSRGTVVDIPSLINASRSGKLAGAALDVYPNEPGGNGDYFNNDLNTWTTDLRSLKNIILTPHIGGSTEEAQSAIGAEVGHALVSYVNEGSTTGAVNMPEVSVRTTEPNLARVLFIHQNVPGVLRKVNTILADYNIERQKSESRGKVAYLMLEVSGAGEQEIATLYKELESVQACIRTRVLY